MQSTKHKYKVGDILLEDRSVYLMQNERDKNNPLMILRLKKIVPQFEYQGNVYENRLSYVFENMTVNTITFGAVEDIDNAKNFRIATELEISIYAS